MDCSTVTDDSTKRSVCSLGPVRNPKLAEYG